LSEDDIRHAVSILRQKNVEAVAICFIHAYANPLHEVAARALVKQLMPNTYLCTSSEVLAEFREYERFATTSVNASLMPIVDRYLTRFEKGVGDFGITCIPRVMQSNGGAVSQAAVRRLPVNTFFSGPAGGVIGAVGLGRQLSLGDLITFDMGGTSTDVCLIKNGVPATKNERDMGGFPVRTRTLDIHTIGAGGGSLAWIDPGGMLKVGPQSAGAYPGPVAYGRGGQKPTVTDANVVLGRLNPRGLLGGRMKMFPEDAHDAVQNELAGSLGNEVVAAAAGILQIITVNMIGALRVISVEQGEDPRDFTLVAFGGAGPLHAAEVARNIGMRRVLVPPRPGLLSAIGQLHADVRGDFSLTQIVPASSASLQRVNRALADLRLEGEQWLAGETEDAHRAGFEWLAELRYVGQSSELALSLPIGELGPADVDTLLADFHERHDKLYGYKLPDYPVEIVTLRLTVVASRPTPPFEEIRSSGANVDGAFLETRRVWFSETGWVETPIYDRTLLPAGCRLSGPAIVEQMDTTTVVPPRSILSNDRYGCLLIELEPALS
jgi:N-methylhydantoinase A